MTGERVMRHSARMDISVLIGPPVQRQELARVLDDVADDVRFKSIYELGRTELARLFEAAADNDPLRLEHFVPADMPAGAQVVHWGKNSLGLFRRFQKRFCRPATRASELWGYNEHALRRLTGPGYFVGREDEAKQVVLDYGALPTSLEGTLPREWPRVGGNDAGLARLIFGGKRDRLRRVSNAVSIGRVEQNGRALDIWFALVRVTGRFSSTDPFPRP
jgi:hypothetical protein